MVSPLFKLMVPGLLVLSITGKRQPICLRNMKSQSGTSQLWRPELAKQSGDVMDMLVAASEEKKRRNHDLLKALIRSVYFLVKHHIIILYLTRPILKI